MASGTNFSLKAGTDNYCVIGNPVAHSKSPQIHAIFARQCAQNLHYFALRVGPGSFAQVLSRFQQLYGKGLNVTVPFKAEAWAAVKHRSARADKAGAVNTIWFDAAGESHGDTTDGIGLVKDMQANAIQLKQKRILILGAGGAVRGILGALQEQEIACITIANRTLSRAVELATIFSTDTEVRACAYSDLESGCTDVIINGTSAGLRNELPALDPSMVTGTTCYDMMYADTDTIFVDWAKKSGANMAIDGLGMLVEQAAESFYLWRGVRPDTRAVIEALRKAD